MTEKEVDELISSLRELTSTHDRYVIRRASCAVEFEYLLDTGEVVKGATRAVFKDEVETHIGLGYTYLGIGLLHKEV